MSKQDSIELEGTVTEVLPNATFRVAVSDSHTVLTTLGGNMRRFRIRVLAGDRVRIAYPELGLAVAHARTDALPDNAILVARAMGPARTSTPARP